MKFTKSYLEGVNKTELVQYLTELGYRAHPGMLRTELMNNILEPPSEPLNNPIDEYRNRIMRFLQENWELVNSQLALNCGADCYKHTDAHVLACWLESQNVIQEYEESTKRGT